MKLAGWLVLTRSLIQECISGGGETRLSFGAICDRGRPVGTIVVQQLRQYPIDFGRSSTFVQTQDCSQVESAAHRLIRSTKYSGFIEAEYKLDTRTGRYKLLDVNPRLWGWHSIGPLAGVDFPYLQWKCLAGEAVVQCKGRIGVRWIKMSADLRGMFDQIRRGTASPRDYLNSLRPPLAFAMFAVDDPLPAFFQFPFKVFQQLRKCI